MSETNRSFEENITRLEEIVALLEKGDARLSEALSLFEEGTGLVGTCAAMLDEAELKVVKLQKGPDGAPMESLFAEE